MKLYRHFNYLFLAFMAGSSLLIAGFNVSIDPYGVMNSPRVKGFNWSKPEQLTHARLFKAIALTRPLQLKTLLFGTSRVELGFATDSRTLAAYEPLYNSALPSASMYEQFSYFQHAILNQNNLKLIIIGLDMDMFLKSNEGRTRGDFEQARLETKGIRLMEALRINFSLDAVTDSWATVKKNRQAPDLIYYDSNGFRNIEIIGKPDSSFLDTLGYIFDNDTRESLSTQALAHLQEIQTICEDAGIELKVFITPSHVTHLEALRLTEKWQLYEDWKREAVQMMPVWDFSGYNSITAEPIGEQMKNYKDSTHFYPLVGDLILNRLLGYKEEEIPEDFGVLITPENVEDHLAKIRRDRAIWSQTNSTTIKLLGKLK